MRNAVVALILSLGAAAHVSAQERISVAEALSFLVTSQAVDTGDAARDRAAAEATSRALSRSLLSALATLPLTSSSSGFTYRFNPVLGTLERGSDSFGPFFVERAATAGAGRASLAVNWQYASFTKLDGMALRDGTLVTTANAFEDEAQPFDVETLALRIRTNSLTVSGVVGITDRLDLSAALPIVSLSLEGSRTDTYRSARYQQASASASITRFADLLLRGKFNVARGEWGGVSLGGDLRLPTGAEDDLVGAGELGTRGFVVFTGGTGAVSTHFTAGISRGGVSDGVDFGTAVSVNPAAHVTIAAELFGRRLDLGRLEQVIAPHPALPGVETLRLVEAADHTTQTLGAVGFKWNLADAWLLSATLTLPLNQSGLTARFMPSASVEYNFGR
ncbi:MAG: hypothetical protein EHM24_19535 [Acidobacteria bacterium]|nr:MAG: hypothetical protein EHM24_19535 [Acidobacteriota bacterium]